MVRWICSWDTTEEDVDGLLEAVRSVDRRRESVKADLQPKPVISRVADQIGLAARSCLNVGPPNR